MQHKALAELDLDEKGIPLLLREFDHRMRNLLTVIGATVMHTEFFECRGLSGQADGANFAPPQSISGER